VVGGRVNRTGARAAAPHTPRTVAFDGGEQPFTATGLAGKVRRVLDDVPDGGPSG